GTVTSVQWAATVPAGVPLSWVILKLPRFESPSVVWGPINVCCGSGSVAITWMIFGSASLKVVMQSRTRQTAIGTKTRRPFICSPPEKNCTPYAGAPYSMGLYYCVIWPLKKATILREYNCTCKECCKGNIKFQLIFCNFCG